MSMVWKVALILLQVGKMVGKLRTFFIGIGKMVSSLILHACTLTPGCAISIRSAIFQKSARQQLAQLSR
jgi:hypothetical protein